jgi:UPF0755 protein
VLETLPRRSERKLRSRRRGIIVLLALIVVLVLLVASGGLYWRWATSASGPHAKIIVTIPKGATGSDVAELLKKEGVIRSTLAFRLLSRFRGFRTGFEAGRYETLTTNMTIQDVLAVLKNGPVHLPTVRATFTEGYRISQLALQAQKGLTIPAKTFVAASRSGRFTVPNFLPLRPRSLEGFLFPDTYEFYKGVAVDDVIKKMLGQFETETNRLDWSRLRSLGVTSRYQVVIVASLIEREARYPAERAKVAEVIYNRLKQGMPIQIDATIQYAKGNWAPITPDDTKLDSPYNSYLHTGLPPTPIASPGLASLTAALNPTHSGYLYYLVTDCKGHSTFTSSYQQFLNLKASRPTC